MHELLWEIQICLKRGTHFFQTMEDSRTFWTWPALVQLGPHRKNPVWNMALEKVGETLAWEEW